MNEKMNKSLTLLFIFCISLIVCVRAEYTITKTGGLFKATCSCTCNEKTLSAVGLYGSEAQAVEKCHEQCARSCGGYTDCAHSSERECGICCDTYCSNKYPGAMKKECQQSCKSTCSYRGMVYGITDIIYSVAGVIGALMIVIHAVRMITAQDASDRNSAKNSIIYVVAALIIIFLAGTLVKLFLTAVPATGSTDGGKTTDWGKTTGGCDLVTPQDCEARGIGPDCMKDSCCYLEDTGSAITCSKRI